MRNKVAQDRGECEARVRQERLQGHRRGVRLGLVPGTHHLVMAYIVVAYIVLAYIVMAYVGMAYGLLQIRPYVVMTLCSYGLI